jgi:hypothetical protein
MVIKDRARLESLLENDPELAAIFLRCIVYYGCIVESTIFVRKAATMSEYLPKIGLIL